MPQVAVLSFVTDYHDAQYADMPVKYGIVESDLFSWTPNPFTTRVTDPNQWALGTGEYNNITNAAGKPAQPWYWGYYTVRGHEWVGVGA